MWLNSTSNSVSVCSSTSNVVSSAYLNISFDSDKEHRSDFITAVSVAVAVVVAVVVVLVGGRVVWNYLRSHLDKQ